MYTKVKTEQEIKDMKISGKMLATVLEYLRGEVKVGQTTKQLADLAAAELKRLGGKPAFLGYGGFPDVICISLNNEVVHGIPGKEVIQDGDLVSLDFGVNNNSMITDAAITVIAGESTGQKRKLLKGTEEALYAGIDVLKNGVKTGDIGAAVEKVMTQYGFGIVRDLVGHGVGHQVHEQPDIPNYGTKGSGKKLEAGMTICIEPMSTLGGDSVYMDKDGWTIKTHDDSLSAHFEHTILITETGAEILTQL
jgi:methionyl aminopeptidase